ncbi:hypothetical protein ACRE_053380 [Hapsidospora chrysogenum ATCC 11550]|uniref:Uncharacterized protein n=1 Tax=Hapsidospora chrysogenum (strain ATCC 11550 / CBS 779.69 / DSM 880 / IAM 14645 / JCM 23072 / IMI 49137) TaxID=857340 RepID=A0A086T3E8_HAPC1|nr:hypothetical protein ACRE_053380 [Hapsidospora chrysogenum ATCC 11550]
MWALELSCAKLESIATSSNIEQLVPQDAIYRKLDYNAWLFQEQSTLLPNHYEILVALRWF